MSTSDETRRAVGGGVAFLLIVLTYGPNRFQEWEHWWAAAGTVALGVLIADALVLVRDRLPTPGVAPVPLLVTLLAIGLCVPETDQLAVASIVPVGLVVAELALRRQLGVSWYVVATASVGWAGLFGATGRASALAGALFAWWAFVMVLIVVRRSPDLAGRDLFVVLLLGGVASLVMARTGGITTTPWVIVVSVLACGAVSLGAAVAAGRLNARR